ncbi:hypothetical protein Tco_0123730 [Tanacetum coccineum]
MIIAGADNRPLMLDKTMYDLWKSRMELYIENRENRRMILNLVENGPLIWPTVEENSETRKKKYEELSASEKLQADYEIPTTTTTSTIITTNTNLNKLLHTSTTIKLPDSQKREYRYSWSMEDGTLFGAIQQFRIMEVIQNGNGPISITTDTQGQIKVLPPKTAEEIVARERERKARTTLLIGLPKNHLPNSKDD